MSSYSPELINLLKGAYKKKTDSELTAILVRVCYEREYCKSIMEQSPESLQKKLKERLEESAIKLECIAEEARWRNKWIKT